MKGQREDLIRYVSGNADIVLERKAEIITDTMRFSRQVRCVSRYMYPKLPRLEQVSAAELQTLALTLQLTDETSYDEMFETSCTEAVIDFFKGERITELKAQSLTKAFPATEYDLNKRQGRVVAEARHNDNRDEAIVELIVSKNPGIPAELLRAHVKAMLAGQILSLDVSGKHSQVALQEQPA
jgi:hypothetical protein